MSFQARTEDTGELLDLYSPEPRGTIVFGVGRMAVVVAASSRAPPADEAGVASAFRGMMAYTGRYTVSDTVRRIEVEVEDERGRTGTTERRDGV